MQEGSFTVEGSYTATNGRFQASPFWRATKVSVGWSLMEYGMFLIRLSPSVMGLRAEKISRPSSLHPEVHRNIVLVGHLDGKSGFHVFACHRPLLIIYIE